MINHEELSDLLKSATETLDPEKTESVRHYRPGTIILLPQMGRVWRVMPLGAVAENLFRTFLDVIPFTSAPEKQKTILAPPQVLQLLGAIPENSRIFMVVDSYNGSKNKFRYFIPPGKVIEGESRQQVLEKAQNDRGYLLGALCIELSPEEWESLFQEEESQEEQDLPTREA